MSYREPQDVYTAEDLAKLVKSDNTIHTSITIRGQYLAEIVGVEKIVGDLGCVDSTLSSFGTLREVTGGIWFSSHTVAPSLTSMGNVESVGGDLSLKGSNIKTLGGLKTVGGNLNLRSVAIEDFGSLEFVGGNVLLHKTVQGKLNLSHIEIAGKVKYFNDPIGRLDTIVNPTALSKSDLPVPLWKKAYAFSHKFLDAADAEQKDFYRYFRESFLHDKIVDVRRNSNYVFGLMFDLINDFRSHRDEVVIRRQLAALEKAYPEIQRYTEQNLADAIEGQSETMSVDNSGEEIDSAFSRLIDEIKREHPGLISDDQRDELVAEENEFIVEVSDGDESADEDGNVEEFRFPPLDPRYTIALTETQDDDFQCVDTNVAIDGNSVAAIRARVSSMKADVLADRLFLQTMHATNDDSCSIFAFELSSAKQLWQTREIPPSGSLYIDKAGKTLEAGLTYGYAENYLVRLDYEGNILESNFCDGYAMIAAAEQHLSREEFKPARTLFFQALDTDISISTKIKVAKKLGRIGKASGDTQLMTQSTALTIKLDAEKEIQKNSARPPRTFEESPERVLGKDNYWNKRFKQEEDDGGK